MADDLSTASLPQYSVPGPQIASGSKYQQLLALIEELGKDIRPTYTGNKICAERLKRSIAHSRILVRECLIEAEKDRQKAAADAAVKNHCIIMPASIKLPERPAFARSTKSEVLVSTYQLESAESRVGFIYILSPGLEVLQCIKAPAGVFRFDFLKPKVIIAAVTDGSLFITTYGEKPTSESIPVSENMLLDVSSPSSTRNVACTDKVGNAHIVDVDTGTVVATWIAHSLPYTSEGCEVWTCSLNNVSLCTGGEDATLKVWDTRSKTTVNRVTGFDAGVTFSSWQGENTILTGSYDQHIRLFDLRQTKEPLQIKETAGGVWHIEDVQAHGNPCHVAACMYGGWAILDEKYNITQSDEKAGKELLYGVTMASENLLVYTTFNDYKVTASTI
ncbi:unnamed protein product [Cylicocyclus nassatus]|uniref:methylated diphthine methylhydrolase n=1 Tax=Cylicocyclus nassatus TaxID=53992 RepID=A0AA36M7E7_CYLNA|nr:unnamed protein product [Cylicocyclus nassatus]